ncbi:Predicted acyltransferase, LPLAT superfamily [Reichenbachiella faecimaris]|uniref:Predicted acyltransferase, LPLAT superfamily n=1 Tax=Reichenbachiella faecimaris TaxID=692418 RepID=A0A1W2G6P4_REIFA|nr:lysophospholipid acyltransferase family protein [Reichenbachiella faecimaris]SMD32184.1 Predicted acyltransferase, LPLAT superfamily [Reichenbachiella faecimaris]
MATWDGKTKGTLLGYRIFVLMVNNLGLTVSYFFLRIVSFYYFFFATKNKATLREFYMRYMGFDLAKANSLVKKNFYLLAQSILDKIAFSMGLQHEFTFSNEGEQRLKSLAKDKTGGVLVSAHFGNWDIAGQILKDSNTRVNVVMHDNEHKQIKAYLDQLGGDRFHVIAQKEDMSHLFKIHQATKNGELICIHGDRFVDADQTIELDFLGSRARFPLGPFKLISKLNVPYAFVFTVKTSARHYHFTSTVPTLPNLSVPQLAASFASVLEEKVRQNPEQWFNYHDFFQKADSSHE